MMKQISRPSTVQDVPMTRVFSMRKKMSIDTTLSTRKDDEKEESMFLDGDEIGIPTNSSNIPRNQSRFPPFPMEAFDM